MVEENKDDGVSSLDDLEEIHDYIDRSSHVREDNDDVDKGYPEPSPDSSVYTKYRTEADIPKTQEKYFDQYRGSYGRHVALSNTQRQDNPRHLTALDGQFIYDEIPVMRHRGGQIRIRETSEFQMCRGNPEIGGFEAKLGVTAIRRENVDVKQAQSLVDDRIKKKKRSRGILGILGR